MIIHGRHICSQKSKPRMRATEELFKLNFKASKGTLHYITLIPGILGIYCTIPHVFLLETHKNYMP